MNRSAKLFSSFSAPFSIHALPFESNNPFLRSEIHQRRRRENKKDEDEADF